jgi:hypothetical protein
VHRLNYTFYRLDRPPCTAQDSRQNSTVIGAITHVHVPGRALDIPEGKHEIIPIVTLIQFSGFALSHAKSKRPNAHGIGRVEVTSDAESVCTPVSHAFVSSSRGSHSDWNHNQPKQP